MNINKIVIISSVVIVLLIITIPTTYKIIKTHNNNLYRVVEDKVIAQAKTCYYEEKCLNDKITLKELYKLNYLEKISNPVTKEFYNDESYIINEDGEFKFIVVE